MADLDNAIEHLAIVPQELAIHPERRGHWDWVLEKTCSEKIPAIEDPHDKRLWSLIQWAFLDHVMPDSASRERAIQELQGGGLLDEASRFCEMLVAEMGSKERAVRLCFEVLQIPIEMAVFEYLDSRAGTSHEVPVGPA